MPHIPFQIPFIDEPIRPFVSKSGLVFQRVQRYRSHQPDQHPVTGLLTLYLTVHIQHFVTNADGTAGADASELVPNYDLTYHTDDREVLDAQTGAIAFTRVQETDAEWAAKIAADPRPLVGRGVAYLLLLHGGPVDMVPQIREAMRAADGPPYYRFGGRPDPAPQP